MACPLLSSHLRRHCSRTRELDTDDGNNGKGDNNKRETNRLVPGLLTPRARFETTVSR